jgi:nicotinate-nucleotide pyrophosphorylase (carboxylating)
MSPVAIDTDLNALSLSELFKTLVEDRVIARVLDAAIEEDLGEAGDVTTESIIDPTRTVRATIVARSPGVIAGLPLVPRILNRFGISGDDF